MLENRHRDRDIYHSDEYNDFLINEIGAMEIYDKLELIRPFIRTSKYQRRASCIGCPEKPLCSMNCPRTIGITINYAGIKHNYTLSHPFGGEEPPGYLELDQFLNKLLFDIRERSVEIEGGDHIKELLGGLPIICGLGLSRSPKETASTLKEKYRNLREASKTDRLKKDFMLYMPAEEEVSRRDLIEHFRLGESEADEILNRLVQDVTIYRTDRTHFRKFFTDPWG